MRPDFQISRWRKAGLFCQNNARRDHETSLHFTLTGIVCWGLEMHVEYVVCQRVPPHELAHRYSVSAYARWQKSTPVGLSVPAQALARAHQTAWCACGECSFVWSSRRDRITPASSLICLLGNGKMLCRCSSAEASASGWQTYSGFFFGVCVTVVCVCVCVCVFESCGMV